ncbi:MAG: ribosome maturation factor RimM [Bacillota bacterium]|nr:ribosome maturation factor RimM [Bacillota bacterium]
MKEYLSVGQIINTHGVKGELKVFPLTDDIKRFRKLKNVMVDGSPMNIVWCKIQNDKVILKIEGIDSMEQAEKYKGKYIAVSREDAVKLPKDSYFVTDLIGCRVIDENNIHIGKVKEVIFTGSNDVYWVKNDDNKDIMIPALKSVVVSIDINNREIVIKPLEVWYED